MNRRIGEGRQDEKDVAGGNSRDEKEGHDTRRLLDGASERGGE